MFFLRFLTFIWYNEKQKKKEKPPKLVKFIKFLEKMYHLGKNVWQKKGRAESTQSSAKRISKISSTKEVFENAIKEYQKSLTLNIINL